MIPLCALLLALMLSQFSLPASRSSRTPAQAAPAAAQVKSLSVAGLAAPVKISRDERGIPHIEAASDADLYFAQGYATAQDRLWQMDLLRRTERGELSEIFGQATLEQDKLRRTYGFARLSDVLLAKASPGSRAALDSYARGVNAYLASLDGTQGKQLPREFQLLQYKPRPWQPSDSIVIGKLFAEALSTTWQTDLFRASLADLPPARRAELLPDSSPLDVLVVGTDEVKRDAQPTRRAPGSAVPPARGARPALPVDTAERRALLAEAMRLLDESRASLARVGVDAEARAASNNWVVSGKRTATGKPLLANDPHLAPSAPSIWHMVHLTARGVNVAGVTAPGAPGVILGHNEQIAWGATNLGPDVQDLYAEKFNPEKPNSYMTPQGWREAEVRREEIRVRKNPAGSFEDFTTVAHEVTVTRHGPITLERGGVRYALRWTAFDADATEFEAFYKLNRARDWDEFRAALSAYRGPTQNFIYADVRGHIGYYGAGMIPVRKTGDGSTPYDGATDAGEWTGYIPFAELPHSYDPPSGLIVTANSRVVGRSYTHFLTHDWADAYRARRIYDLLKDKQRLTAEDFRAAQADAYSIGGAAFAREAAKLLRATATSAAAAQPAPDEAKLRESVAALEGWDGRVAADSRVAPLVAEMRAAFRRRILVAALGAERFSLYRWSSRDTFFERLITERTPAWLPKEFKDYGELLRACLADARAALSTRLGADEAQWTWGRYAPARFPHPLASVPLVGQQFLIQPFPQHGSGGAAGATPNVGAGVSMRLIADTSDWDKTQQGIALGESGDPASPHWSDQLPDWRAATPRPFPFTARAVAAAAKDIVELRPAGR